MDDTAETDSEPWTAYEAFLDGGELVASGEPIQLFESWLEEATELEPNDPTSMSVATADAKGVPSLRMLLLKHVDERGFVFYTNMQSRKGVEMVDNPYAALCFHWKSLRRSVRVEGRVEQVSDEEADAYFASRDRGSQIGAWASDQSRPLGGRFDLEKRVAKYALKFNIGKVPRPPHWTGQRVVPIRIEFWTSRLSRLHDRVIYCRVEDGWRKLELYP